MKSRFIAAVITCGLSILANTGATANLSETSLVLPTDLREFAFRLQRHVERTDLFTLANCSTFIDDLYQQVHTRLPHEFSLGELLYQPTSGMEKTLDGLPLVNIERARLVLTAFFRARLALGERLREFTLESLEKHESPEQDRELKSCINRLRVAHRSLRSWEDYWGLWLVSRAEQQEREAIQAGALSDSERIWNLPHGMYSGPSPYLFVKPGVVASMESTNAGFPAEEFLQTGHIVMTRGNTFTGSVISRIGAVDNQFSHLAWIVRDQDRRFARVDPEHYSGKLYVVEATLEKGLYWIPFAEWRTHHQARSVLYRFRHLKSADKAPAEEIARRAALHLADLAIAGGTTYNFRMDLANRAELFCSQAIQVGIEKACADLTMENGKFACDSLPFPLTKSEFRRRNPLLELLQIQVDHTFAPADVEVDPRLELLVEWRDYKQIRRATLLDSAITKIFQWLEYDGYTFNSSLAPPEFANHFRLLTGLGHRLVTELGRMPANLPRGFVDGTILMGYMIEHSGIGPERFLHGLSSLGSHVGLYPFLVEIERRTIAARRANSAAQGTLGFDLPLSEFEADRALERLRAFDCKNLRLSLAGSALRAPLQFHSFFRTSFTDDELSCPEGESPWNILN